MKKLSILLLLTLLLSGCSAPDDSKESANAQQSSTEQTANAKEDKPVEIEDKLFIAQTNDIYNNLSDYEGRTVHYEGIFMTAIMPDDNSTVPFVIRYGPGCCSNDGSAGFEIALEESEWPKENDWVEVTGIIEVYHDDAYNYDYPVVKISSIVIKEERGLETVST